MKNKNIKSLFTAFTLLSMMLVLWECENYGKDIQLNQQTVTQKTLNINISHWHDIESEHKEISRSLDKFKQKSYSSEDVQSSHYGFSIDETRVQIIEDDEYTTYTFVVKRNEHQEGILENYMYKEFNDGTYKQFLLSYYYIRDPFGKKIFDITDMGVELIEDEGLLLNKTGSGSGECHPHFEEVYDGFLCTTRQRCSGYPISHEIGEECNCQITDMTCVRAGAQVCEHSYSWVFDDCSGGVNTGNIDNPNDPNNSTGGGSSGDGSGGNTGNTQGVPLDVNSDLENFIDLLSTAQSDWWNNRDNHSPRIAVIDYLASNNYSDNSINLSQDYIDFMIDNPDSGFEILSTPHADPDVLNFNSFSEADDFLNNLANNNYTHVSSDLEAGSIRRDVHKIAFNSFPRADLVTSIRAVIPDNANNLECLDILSARTVLEGNNTLFDWEQFDSENVSDTNGPVIDTDETLDRVKISIEGQLSIGLNVGGNPFKARKLITVVITYHYATSEINENYCYWYYTGN